MASDNAHILVVDDNRMNRMTLSHVLKQQGHMVGLAEDGRKALELLSDQQYDLMLLDIMMPVMDGIEVLQRLRDNDMLRHIPVIVVSALNQIDSVARCIELGAEDYLTKPFDPVLLNARIGASLEKKRLRDQEQAYLKQLQIEQEKSESLLLNVLPKPIADRLKQGEGVIADFFPEVTIMFADIVDFTTIATRMAPADLVHHLNELFSIFDELAGAYGLEKIKTSGDAYIIAGGLPTPRADHAEAVANLALDIQKAAADFTINGRIPVDIRIGINTGQVVAGVIGTKKFSYDFWGDAVNTADRMQSHGLRNRIQTTESTYQCLKDRFEFESRGVIPVKGKGEMATYMLESRK